MSINTKVTIPPDKVVSIRKYDYSLTYPDGHGGAPVQDGLTARLDHFLVVAAISGSGDQAGAVDVVYGFRAGFGLRDRGDNVFYGAVAVADGNQTGAAEVDVLEVIGAWFGVGGRRRRRSYA